MSTSVCLIRSTIQWIWRVMYGKTRMDLIDKMRKEALGEGEERMSLQETIIQEIGCQTGDLMPRKKSVVPLIS